MRRNVAESVTKPTAMKYKRRICLAMDFISGPYAVCHFEVKADGFLQAWVGRMLFRGLSTADMNAMTDHVTNSTTTMPRSIQKASGSSTFAFH